MNIWQRAGKAYRAFRSDIDMNAVAQRLDAMMVSGELPTARQVEQAVEKQSDPASKLDIRRTERNIMYATMYSSLRSWTSRTNNILDNHDYNDPSRDFALAEIWKLEPIMAGAIYSMCAKFSALSWNITGKRLPAKRYATILSEAAHMGGYGWGAYIASVANDFYTVNRGTFSETAKDGDNVYGPLAGLGHIDALNCTLTGNTKTPMEYWSDTTGQHIAFRPGEYFHFASLPSPREMHVGMGFCAVDRSLRSLKLLMGLHDYDDEKLSNLPPEGVATVTGLTMDEFNDALALWKAARQRDQSLTFPQVLWLIGSQPNAEVKVSLTGFSNLPESFDRKSVVDQYATSLALCFGIDVREIWTIASGGGLGSAGESEIQHMKAKGKGPGEFITAMERHINGELPEGVDWRFDTQDIEEDANQAAIHKAIIDAYFPLYNLPPAGEKSAEGVTNPRTKANPQPDKPNGQPNLPTTPIPGVDTGRDMTNGGGQPNQPRQAEQVIDKKDFLRLLVDKGVLPQWMVNDERSMLTDTSVHVSKDGYAEDTVKYVWDGRTGILKEERIYLGNIHSEQVLDFVPDANIEKGGEGSGNWGHEGRPGEIGGSAGGGGLGKIANYSRDVGARRDAAAHYRELRSAMSGISRDDRVAVATSLRKVYFNGIDNGTEMLIGIKDGKIVGAKQGNATSVAGIGDIINGSTAMVHNHPSSTSFSEEDVNCMIGTNIDSMFVIGHNRDVYYLVKTGKSNPTSGDVKAAFTLGYNSTINDYHRIVNGYGNSRLAQNEAWHKANGLAANAIGFKYGRLKYGVDYGK